MSITVNTNLPSLIAQKNLLNATNSMNTALQRMSTGYRINSSKDDAAGMAISNKFEYKTSSYKVANDNAQMGQSMLETTNGSLSNINSMLQRMRDLTEQAANGTYGEDERNAMQMEINALTEEIYRIKNTTEFNGKNLFGEETTRKTTSITESEAIAQGYKVVKTAEEFQEAFYQEKSGGDFDLVNGRYVKVATGTGNYEQDLDAKVMLFEDIDLNDLGFDDTGSNWTAIGTHVDSSFKGVFDGNGHTISNLTINRPNELYEGVFGRAVGATFQNVDINNANVVGNRYVAFLCGVISQCEVENCNIKNSEIVTDVVAGGLVGELNGLNNIKNSSVNDINLVLSSSPYSSPRLGGLIGTVYTSYALVENCYVDAKIDSSIADCGGCIGYIGDGTLGINISNCYYNKETNGDSIKPIGYPADTSAYNIDIKESTTNPFEDFSNEVNLQVGINNDENSVITVDTGFTLGDLNISLMTDYSARNSLDKLDELMERVSNKMTEIGAAQNRLESVIAAQETQIMTMTAANSLIKDVDIAEESSNYIKSQILQQTTASLLATANQCPSIALQLV